MAIRRSRSVLTLVLAVFAGATALAQRGGYRPTQSYSGNVPYDGKFVFVRVSYPWFGGRGAPWAHDYPAGERHFTRILSELTSVRTHTDESSIMSLSDPEIFKNPLIYMAEPGTWSMSDEDVKNLRAYLLKGGFLILDDDRYNHWANIDLQVSKLFPEGRWVELDGTHQVFHSFFEIDHPEQIPQYYDPPPPHFMALFEDNNPNKRMLILCNFSTDISEFWEWSDTGYKPIDENNWAYKVGINEFIYGIIH
jgi:hypothetical protein